MEDALEKFSSSSEEEDDRLEAIRQGVASNLKEMVLLARELGADVRLCLSLDESIVVKDASKSFEIEAAGHLESHNDR